MGEQLGDSIDPTAFEVGKHQVDQAVVLTVSGEVDMLSSPQLAEAIETARATRPTALIVDLSKVNFLASAGMTVLVTAQAEVQPPTRFAGRTPRSAEWNTGGSASRSATWVIC